MRAYFQGNTYLVEFTDSDAHCFTAHTDAKPGVVAGRGAFVFDTRSGDMIDARGAAGQHGGRMEWLAFSQDAQDYGRNQLAREGVVVNPFDFTAHMRELAANPKKGKKSPAGRRVELIHTPDQWTSLKPGTQGTVTFVDDAGTIFVDWDDGQRLGLVPGTDHFQYVTQSNPGKAEHKRIALDLLDEGKRLLKQATARKYDYDWYNNLEAHNEACALGRHAYADTWMAESQILHVPELEEKIFTLRDDVVKLLNELRCPWSDIMYGRAENPAPVGRISRTRGVKTMRGPYDARRGYRPWITRRGKLGTGFLTTMTKAERHKSLDRCVREYGYRSCLGSIMVLERGKRSRDGGEGVGVKYASQLKESRDYLKKKYGGAGSFGPRKKEDRRFAVANPSANPGHACVWKTVTLSRSAPIPFLVWTGGIPTTEEIHAAPNFTIFPSPKRVRGKLPLGESIKITDDEGTYDAMPWFVAERDPPYNATVRGVLADALDWDGNDWLNTIVNTDDDLRGETHDWGRGPIEIQGDDQAWPWAIERGYTLIKVPDALQGGASQYAEVYVLDEPWREGYSSYFKQAPLRAQLLKFAKRQHATNPSGSAADNPCFGLHVHGEQVGPTLRQLQGNPTPEEHFKRAQKLAGGIDKKLARVQKQLDSIETKADRRGTTGLPTAVEVKKVGRAAAEMEELLEEMVEFQVEARYSGREIALPSYDTDSVMTLIQHLWGVERSCARCDVASMGHYEHIREDAQIDYQRAKVRASLENNARGLALAENYLRKAQARQATAEGEREIAAGAKRMKMLQVRIARRKEAIHNALQMANALGGVDSQAALARGQKAAEEQTAKRRKAIERRRAALGKQIKAAKKKSAKKKTAKKKTAKKKSAKKKPAKKKPARDLTKKKPTTLAARRRAADKKKTSKVLKRR